MTTVKIFGFPPSTYTQSAILTAEDVGVPYELAPLEFKEASHLARHPYGKMPAMEHGPVKLYETLAIMAYLDRELGASKLTPDKPVGNATMLMWASVGIDYGYRSLVCPLHGDDIAAQDATQAAEQLKLLDAGLGKQAFFCGDSVSLADFLLFPMVRFALNKLGETKPAGLPALTTWQSRISERESARRLEKIA